MFDTTTSLPGGCKNYEIDRPALADSSRKVIKTGSSPVGYAIPSLSMNDCSVIDV